MEKRYLIAAGVFQTTLHHLLGETLYLPVVR